MFLFEWEKKLKILNEIPYKEYEKVEKDLSYEIKVKRPKDWATSFF